MLNHVRLFMLSQIHGPDPWAKRPVDTQSEPIRPARIEAPTISKLNMPLRNLIRMCRRHLVLLKLEGEPFNWGSVALLCITYFWKGGELRNSKYVWCMKLIRFCGRSLCDVQMHALTCILYGAKWTTRLGLLVSLQFCRGVSLRNCIPSSLLSSFFRALDAGDVLQSGYLLSPSSDGFA